MTDPKNTEDQELSLDQLKDAAGGYCQVELTTKEFKDSKPKGSSIAKQNIEPGTVQIRSDYGAVQ